MNRDLPTKTQNDKATQPKRLVDLSATQLTGGALAAMTSAIIGAQLGVAGTIIGAALGSIVAGVAGSIYTASLRHTKEKITSVVVGRVGDTKVDVAVVSDDTAVRDDWSWDADANQPIAATAPPTSDPLAADVVVDERGKPARQLPWKPILVSAAAVFLIAIAGITGFELISGQAISGGEGTTITQVGEGRSGGSDTPSAPSSTPSSEISTEPSAPASASSEPSSAASAEPTNEPTTSNEPTSQPSAGNESADASPATGSGGGAPADSGDGGPVVGG